MLFGHRNAQPAARKMWDCARFFPFLNGLVLGSIVLLFSLGLTLNYGAGRIVNFAHGALFSAGAMCGVWMVLSGFPFGLVLILAPFWLGL